MDTNNKASTSHIKSDSSDEDDERHENYSTEELSLKLKTFRNLCLENKINVNSAFEIDMIGYFHSWLKKKKSSIFDDTTFQEISDYLEASEIIYAYRVDNLAETTSKLVEQFKFNNPSYSTTRIKDDDNATAVQKSKRQNMMLTTNEKLRRTPRENEKYSFDSEINHMTSSFSCRELLSVGSPFRFMRSLYSNETLPEEMKRVRENSTKKVEDYETIEVDKSFLELSDALSKRAICPEFKGFIAARDKGDNSNNDQLNGNKYHFDPNVHQFIYNSEASICDEPNNSKLDERKDIISNFNVNDNIDENSQQNIKQTYKKHNQVKDESVKIDWLDMSQIDKLLKKNDEDGKYISPFTLQKWDPLVNISDMRAIVADVPYKFNFLKYTEIKPDWWKGHKNLELNPEDENVIADIDTESKMDVRELKKEISDIIDEQCVETNTNGEWSSKLSFFNLLTMLRVNERDELSIPIVFVGLLHLANERGLKLFQEHCIINDMEETFIAKLLSKE
ncbi:uncharacterized protein LOC111042259 [Myzus persicae]|uniref:uncharacterized protein LOC111042259 n=1 Tax=Myzus persicae TaxID=13164 RepID=UPI000B936CBD|nr:uncharacterized protein LOC111042259 [Myzus persicae]